MKWIGLVLVMFFLAGCAVTQKAVVKPEVLRTEQNALYNVKIIHYKDGTTEARDMTAQERAEEMLYRTGYQAKKRAEVEALTKELEPVAEEVQEDGGLLSGSAEGSAK